MKVQRVKVISTYEKIQLRVKPLKSFLVKNDICRMTQMSGAFDKSEFEGNTTLLGINEENGKKLCIYWWRYDLLLSN